MNPRKQYLTGPQVLERYGGRSSMWLWRKLRLDPKFPRPVVIARRRYFDQDELDRHDEAVRSEARTARASRETDTV
jgi:hypothetical protein